MWGGGGGATPTKTTRLPWVEFNSATDSLIPMAQAKQHGLLQSGIYLRENHGVPFAAEIHSARR